MQIIKDKFNFKILGLGGLLALGLLVAGQTSAQAQDAPPAPPENPGAARLAPPRDREQTRAPRRRGEQPPPPPVAPDNQGPVAPGEPQGMPLPAMNPAAEQGMRDGVLQGAQDRSSNRGFRPQKARDYKRASNGYQSGIGDKRGYKDAYRQGFVRGYDRGFGGDRGEMAPPPVPPEANRPRPERADRRRPQPPASQDAPPAPPVNN